LEIQGFIDSAEKHFLRGFFYISLEYQGSKGKPERKYVDSMAIPEPHTNCTDRSFTWPPHCQLSLGDMGLGEKSPS
jgi:hypothetical protein